MINTRLKIILLISLLLTSIIIATFIALKHLQDANFDRLDYIMQTENAVDTLRSRLWILQEFQDEEALTQTKAAHDILSQQLSTHHFKKIAITSIFTNLIRMNDNLGALLTFADKGLATTTKHGITSTNGMLTARFNMTLQAMSEELTSAQSLMIRHVAHQQKIILYFAICILLLGSLALLHQIQATLKVFNQSLLRLTKGILRLSKGDLQTKIMIQQDNELSDVAEQFNKMTLRLNETTIKKEALQFEVQRQTQQLQAQHEKLKFVAEHDDLTQLYSRSAFERQIDTAIARCHRTGIHAALLFIDLDKFKQINDSLGHHIGDQVLVECAARLLKSVRSSDICARIGGDEFVIWLEPISGLLEVKLVCDKILKNLSQPLNLPSHQVRLEASIGIALLPNDDVARQALIKIADDNMYLAKLTTGNSYQFSESANSALNNLHFL